jgi:hypothetical protein
MGYRKLQTELRGDTGVIMINSISEHKAILKIVRQNRIDFAEKLYAFATFMSLIWQYCTVIYYPVLRSSISSLVTVADLLIWALACLNLAVEKKNIKRQIKIVLPAFILFMFLAVKLIISGNFSNDYFAPSRALYQIYSLVYVLFWGLSFRLLSTKIKKKLLFGFYIVLTVTVIPSFFHVFRFKDAIRDGGPYYGIIDFQYIYSVIPLIGITIVTLFCGKIDKKLRLIMVFMVVLNVAVILVSNFVTAVMFICFTIVFSFLIAKKVQFKKMLKVMVVVLLIGFIFRNLIAELFFALENSNAFSVVMQHRLHDIGNIFASGELGWSFMARIELMENSWHTFLQNPVFGVPFNKSGRDILGYHETWFTLLGYGGILGLILLSISVRAYLSFVTKYMGSKFYVKAYLMMLVVVFLLSFFNPILTKSILMIALGLMPTLDCLYVSNSHKEEEEKCKKIKFH